MSQTMKRNVFMVIVFEHPDLAVFYISKKVTFYASSILGGASLKA